MVLGPTALQATDCSDFTETQSRIGAIGATGEIGGSRPMEEALK
ncbi:MAG: hypothetical protein ABR562_09105 [Thermoplasmatota archaeon]